MLSCLQDSHGGPSRLESPALEGLCVVVWQRPLCQMAHVWRTPPADTCWRGLKSSPGRRWFVTIQLQLQIFSGTGGLRPSRHGDYSTAQGGPTWSWDSQWCLLFTCCLCVHLLKNWLVRLQRPQRKAGMQTIIWHFPTIPWNFKLRKMVHPRLPTCTNALKLNKFLLLINTSAKIDTERNFLLHITKTLSQS